MRLEMSYKDPKVPADYRCSRCGAGGRKLWRDTNTFHPDLFCVDCNNARKGTEIEPDEQGRVPCEHFKRKTDHFNDLVPAIPTEDGIGFWGLTSVPEEGVNWWRALPLRPEVVAVSLAALRTWVKSKALVETGERFLNVPTRWLDNPRWRCLRGHVSGRYLKSEEHGDLCLACHEKVVLTFPEDVDGQIEIPPEIPPSETPPSETPPVQPEPTKGGNHP